MAKKSRRSWFQSGIWVLEPAWWTWPEELDVVWEVVSDHEDRWALSILHDASLSSWPTAVSGGLLPEAFRTASM